MRKPRHREVNKLSRQNWDSSPGLSDSPPPVQYHDRSAEFSTSTVSRHSLGHPASPSPPKREDSVCGSLSKSQAICPWSCPSPSNFLRLPSPSAMHVLSPAHASRPGSRQQVNQEPLLSLMAPVGGHLCPRAWGHREVQGG